MDFSQMTEEDLKRHAEQCNRRREEAQRQIDLNILREKAEEDERRTAYYEEAARPAAKAAPNPEASSSDNRGFQDFIDEIFGRPHGKVTSSSNRNGINTVDFVCFLGSKILKSFKHDIVKIFFSVGLATLVTWLFSSIDGIKGQVTDPHYLGSIALQYGVALFIVWMASFLITGFILLLNQHRWEENATSSSLTGDWRRESETENERNRWYMVFFTMIIVMDVGTGIVWSLGKVTNDGVGEVIFITIGAAFLIGVDLFRHI